MAEIFDERYKEVVARVISYDMSLRLKLACALEDLDTMDDEEWGTMTYGTMVQAMLEIIEAHNKAAIAASNSQYVPMLVEALKRMRNENSDPYGIAKYTLQKLPEELRG